jgi:hypothetical protein
LPVTDVAVKALGGIAGGEMLAALVLGVMQTAEATAPRRVRVASRGYGVEEPGSN